MLAAAFAVLALVLFGRLPGDRRWVSELGDSAHGPAFAVVTLILIAVLRRIPNRRATVLSDYSLAIAAGLLLGALVEVLQFVTGRDASVGDLLRNALGGLAAIGFFAVFDPRVQALPRSSAIRRTSMLVGVVSTAVIIAPMAVTGAAYLQRNRNFPILVDFAAPLSTYFLGVYSAVSVKRMVLPSNVSGVESETMGLRARLIGEEGWKLIIWEPRPDWRGHDWMKLDVANPTDDPLTIDVRILDKHPRRDRRIGDLGTIEVSPRSRETVMLGLPQPASAGAKDSVDLAAVRSVVLKRSSANQAREFYLVRIWLE